LGTTPLRHRLFDGRTLFWVLAAICFVIVYLAWFPGVFTRDEEDIVLQNIHHAYHDGHSPLLVRLWQITGAIKIGPAIPYFIASAAAIYLSASLLRLILPSKLSSSVALVCFIFSPPVFASLGLVTKDLFFADSMMCAVLCMSRFARYPTPIRAISTFGSFYIPAFIRVEAIFALVPLFLWFLVCLATSKSNPGHSTIARTSRVVVIFTFIFAILTIPLVISTVNRYAFHANPFHGEQPLLLFDLATISVQTDMMLIPKSRLGSAGFPMSLLRARLSSSAVDSVIWGPDAHGLIYSPNADQNELLRAWMEALRKHPQQYVRARAEYAARFFGLRNDVPWLRGQFLGDESMVQRLPEQGWLRTKSVLQEFYGTLAASPGWRHYAYVPWVWLLVGIASWLIWSYRSSGPLVPHSFFVCATLAMSAISHNLIMCIVSASTLARYHTWPRIVFGLLFAAAVASFLPSKEPRNHEQGSSSI